MKKIFYINEARSFNHMLDTIAAGFRNQVNNLKKIQPNELVRDYFGNLKYLQPKFLSGQSFKKLENIGNFQKKILNKANELLPNYTSFDKFSQIWKNYASAMARRRPESVLPKFNFMNYVISNGGNQNIISTKGADFVVHRTPEDIIVPSHFAPRGLKSGYRGIGELKERGKVLFAVTPDLEPMLKKAGYITLPVPVQAMFRGNTVNKKIAVSDKETFDYLQDEVLKRAQEYGDLFKYARGRKITKFDGTITYEEPKKPDPMEKLKYGLQSLHDDLFNTTFRESIRNYNERFAHEIAQAKAKAILKNNYFPFKRDEDGWFKRLKIKRF